MADKKKNNKQEVPDNKKLAALEARVEGLNEQLEEAEEKRKEAVTQADQARQQAADAKADYLRLMAEFDTFRRRTSTSFER